MTGNPPGPSPLLRQRNDDGTEENPKQELSAIERRVEKLKASNQEMLKELEEAQQRAQRLVKSLGFTTVMEAQVTIDNADTEVPYKECLKMVEELQMDLIRERMKTEKLKESLRCAEEERDSFKLMAAAAEERPPIESQDNPVKQLAVLQAKYDALLEVKERAAARYKSDYKKWREFRDWIFEDNGIGKESIYKELMKKKQKLMELGNDFDMGERVPIKVPDIPPASPANHPMDLDADKENQVTPKRAEKRKRVSSVIPRMTPPPLALLASRESTMPPEESSKLKDTKMDNDISSKPANPARSESPNVFLEPSSKKFPLSSRPPLASQTNFNDIKDEPMSSPTLSPMDSPKRPLIPNSSDTEDDSQALSFHPSLVCQPSVPFPFPPFQAPAIPPVPSSTPRPKPRPANASNPPSTATSSTVTQLKPRPHPSLSQEPPRTRTRNANPNDDDNDDIKDRLAPRSQSADPDFERPQKIRRLTELVDAANATTTARARPRPTPRKAGAGAGGSTNAFVTPTKSLDKRREQDLFPTVPGPGDDEKEGDADRSTVARDEWGQLHTPVTGNRGKGKQKDASGAVSTPVSSMPPPPSNGKGKVLSDYSAYKGRGRYAKDLESKGKTLNAQFAINSEQNAGMDHQYDEVVRKRDERRKMDGVDCECCREYYEAVGPLPKGLQAPPWRSPSPTSSSSSARARGGGCSKHNPDLGALSTVDNDDDQDTSERERAIAEHRQSVSRHRQHWARGETPPAYWNIAFPSTQEAAEINEKAREMHERKERELGAMARKGDGKYRRR